MDVSSRSQTSRPLLNKVPEITLFFWIIKVLCTMIGESAADYINETLGFGLGNTTVLMSTILLVVQFRLRRYVRLCTGPRWFSSVWSGRWSRTTSPTGWV